MKLKKILSICLVGAMAATLLTACGSSDETVGEEIKDDAEKVVEDVKDVAEEAAEDVKDVAEDVGEGVKDAVEDVGEDVKDAAEEAVEDVKDNAGGDIEYSFKGFDQTITIKGYGMTLFTVDGLEEVVEAVNEITVPAINVELDYTLLEMAAYSEQIGLMFSGGESFDLFQITPVESVMFSTMVSENKLLDISDYVYEYAAETMEFMEEYTTPYELNGGLYGLPDFRIYTSYVYVSMRKDILDYLGLTEQAEAISSWSDLEAIFEAVYDAQDELPEDLQTPNVITNGTNGQIIPLGGYDCATDDFSGHYGYDTLSEANAIVYVDENGQVSDYYEMQDYLDTINRVRNWYLNDWVNKDAATNVDNGTIAMANGVAFCNMQTAEIGVEASAKKQTGYDVLCLNACDPVIGSSTATDWGWGVPVTADEPEAAVAFLNLMYTNPDIENLFVYGIEGRDYEVNEEGEAVTLENNLYQGSDWMYPNQFNSYPTEGQGGDFREYSLELTMDSELSPYYGFSVDTDPISNEIQALSAVVEQYTPGLNSGTIDASETYDEFIDALYSAGLETLLEFYQSALDEWVAAQ